MVPDSSFAALDSIESFNNSTSLKYLTTRKLKAHQSGQWWVIKRNAPPKRVSNGAKIELNSSVHAWISTDPTATLTLNYTEKVNKMRNILSYWEYRRLTLIGKIQVIKRLALSHLSLHFNTTSDKPKVYQ